MTRRRFRRGAILLSLVAAGVVIVALGWFPQEPLRRDLESRLRAVAGPTARIGRLQVRPGRLTVEAFDVAVEGPTYSIEIPQARLVLLAPTLFGRSLALRSLEVDSPRITVRPAPRPGPAFAPPPAILIETLTVSRGVIVYRDPALGGDVTLGGIDVHGSVGSGAITLKADEGSWPRTKPVAFGPIEARLRVSPLLRLDLDSFEAHFGSGSVLRASGRVGRPGALSLDLRLQATIDASDLARLDGPRLEGVVAAEGRVTGAPASMGFEGRLEGSLLGGRVEGRAALSGSAFEGRIRASTIDLERLRRAFPTELPSIRGAGSGEIGWKGDITRELDLTASVDLAAQGPSGPPLRSQASAKGRFHVSDRALDLAWSGSVEAGAWAGGPGAPRLERARLEAVGSARGVAPPVLEGSVEGRIALGTVGGPAEVLVGGTLRSHGRDNALRLQARGLGGSFEASVDAQGPVLRRLSLKADKVQLDQLVAGVVGRAGLGLEGSGPLDQISGTGFVRMEDLAWRDLAIGVLEARLEATRGEARFDLEVPALRLTGRGRLPAGPPRELTATLTFAGTPLGAFAPLLPKPARAFEGRASGTAEVMVPLDRIERAEVRTHFEELEVHRDRLSARAVHPFDVTYREGRIAVSGLEAEGPGLSLKGSAELGTAASSTLEGRVVLVADLSQIPVPSGWSAEGHVEADAMFVGTLSLPRATGTVTIRGMSAQGPLFPPISMAEGRIDLAGDAIHLPALTADVAGGSVTVSGAVPLASLLRAARGRPDAIDPAEEARLDVRWQGLQAQALMERLRPGGATGLGASLAGEAHFEGGLAALEEVRGRATMAATSVRVQEVGLEIAAFPVVLDRGRLAADDVLVSGEGGALQVKAGADLVQRTLDLSAKGRLELRALSPFLGQASLAGTAEADLSVTGSFDDPRPQGRVRVQDATLRLRQVPQALTALSGSVVFDGSVVRVEDGSAALGGGTVAVSGSGALQRGTLADLHLDLRGRDIALRYPEGLRSRLDADLTLTGSGGALLLSGVVRAQRGLYDLDIAFEDSLLAPVPRRVESPLLRSVALDIRVEIENPVLVRNNLARLEATGSLTARGDMESPAPFGRLEIRPGGKVKLQDREFSVTSGALVYGGSWDPEIAVTAEAEIPTAEDRYKVTVSAEGSLQKPSLAFRSDRGLSEREIVSLIATGRTGGQAMTSSAWMAGQQAATLLTSRLTRGVASSLRGLGLDEVTIQPELLARETDPGARFTFGKRLTRDVSLVYSVSLTNAEERFIQLEGRPGKGVALMVQRQDDGTLTYGAGQKLRWGGGRQLAEAATEEKVRIREVRIEGESPVADSTRRGRLRARPGKKLSGWELQEDADRLRERLIEEGYLEAEVGARFEQDVAVFRLRSGPRYHWRIEGMASPPDLTGEIRKALYEEEALEKGRERLLRELRGRGHLRAKVAAKAVPEKEGRALLFQAEPGPRVQAGEVLFPGSAVLSHARLLRAAGGVAALLVSPDEASQGIKAAYRERNYLSAEVDPAQVSESNGSVRIIVPIREGPPARIMAVRFEGVTSSDESLKSRAGIEAGALYSETAVAAAVATVRDHYFGLGYPAVRVLPEIIPAGTDVEVVLRVTEGERVVVGAVTLEGLGRTRESLVRHQIPLKPGDPLDPRKLSAAERRLSTLGVFSRVAVTASENPATVHVLVEEDARFAAAYDARYNSKEKGSALVEAEARNLLGAGLTVGGRYRVGADIRESRGTLHLPSPFGRPGNLTASAFRLEEKLPAFEAGSHNTRVQQGFQLQQAVPFGDRWNLLYGYRFKRVSFTSFEPIHTAGVDASLVRDTRDNALDARRGRFLSLNLQLSPSAFGSDFNFIKGFAQAFLTRGVGASLTWAQGYRLGLAHVFGGEPLPSFERFQAGGANSIRGFDTESVGPRSSLGDPVGGEAVIIINQELRYLHGSGLGAVVFYDGGNVFPTVQAVSFDLRHSLGFGLRWDSPIGLLRADVGFPLSRRPGERAYRLFFSFGQAF